MFKVKVLAGLVSGETFLPGTFLPGFRMATTYLPGFRISTTYLPGFRMATTYLPGLRMATTYLPGLRMATTYLPGLRMATIYLPGLRMATIYLPGSSHGLCFAHVHSLCIFLFFLKILIYLFGCTRSWFWCLESLVVACGI